MIRWLAAGVVGAAVGCAPSPKETLVEYRRALRHGDAERVASLHAEASTLAKTETVAQLRDEHAALWAEAIEQLGGEVAGIRMIAELRLTTGSTITLVKQGAGWRVAAGLLRPPSADTPEAALQTLAAGVAAGDLQAVRSVIPEALQARFATDRALSKHIEQIRRRVATAIRRIGRLRPGLALVSGDRATLHYEGERRVRFVQESKRWRVLDVE